MKSYENLNEEELKIKIAQDFFQKFEYVPFSRLDFTLKQKNTDLPFYLLWAEAKKSSADILNSFTQLVLTIGVNTDLQNIPKPPFLAVFDSEKIAFIEYAALHYFCDSSLFNEISWQNITPSNHLADEFIKTKNRIHPIVEENAQIFYFEENDKELKDFILNSLSKGELNPVVVTDKNFDYIYSNWLLEVFEKEVIDFKEFDSLRSQMILLESDFFLADLISEDDKTLNKNLRIILDKKADGEKIYHFKYKQDTGIFKDRDLDIEIEIIKPEIHTNFWKMYKRPPEEQFWKEIFNRRDKLAPKDIRERKGAFFTPAVWVKKAQEYLKESLGENWQDDYYIWDCAAGTGNLLVGLKNPARLFASTIDLNDVVMMKQIVKMEQNKDGEKLKLLEKHIFQFDFLNDDFSKLPDNLQKIINETPEKLVIFINPPYAEATNSKTIIGTGQHKKGVALENVYGERYSKELGQAKNELFAQFFMRIYKEIQNCILASFSTLKYVNSANFVKFREIFKAEFLKGFICPAKTFDNVSGEFPIGFLVWNTKNKQCFEYVTLDIYNNEYKKCGDKKFYKTQGRETSIQRFWKTFDDKGEKLAVMVNIPPDFQHNSILAIYQKPRARYCRTITKENIIPFFVYFSVRHAIAHSWINHNDQFLFPNEKWESDKAFQNDCFVFALFHRKNRILSKEGVNHFIPFSEIELNVDKSFESHFLLDFMAGRIKIESNGNGSFVENNFIPQEPMLFSPEAQNVLTAAKAIYIYYHQIASDKRNAWKINDQVKYSCNASFYDIREFFQGRGKKGRMNPKSEDLTYTELLNALKTAQKELALKIEPKIYEYGFLLE